jgi:outer membrane protein OmpA-like peptidoglycan-associated protein
MKRPSTAVVVLAVISVTGCSSWGKQQKKGTVIGAAGGAVVGGVIGHATGSTARGAIIGAAVGGAAGALIGRRMDQQAAELARELPPGTRVSRVGEGIAVTFEDGILFPFDSASLKPEARDNLHELAQSLRDNARTDVLIVGHTDATGRDEYNEGLSRRRASAAASFLGGQGVTRDRLRTEGRGESEPVASNDDESGRQRNRRVEVAIYASEEWREEAKRQAASN